DHCPDCDAGLWGDGFCPGCGDYPNGRSEVWYCPQCGEQAKEKHYLRHNGWVPIFVCEKCLEREAYFRQRSEDQ
ncbi:MAG: hypothetical protein ACTSPB_26100, partial [Candidatus Thorarchaeota archaeon]